MMNTYAAQSMRHRWPMRPSEHTHTQHTHSQLHVLLLFSRLSHLPMNALLKEPLKILDEPTEATVKFNEALLDVLRVKETAHLLVKPFLVEVLQHTDALPKQPVYSDAIIDMSTVRDLLKTHTVDNESMNQGMKQLKNRT